MYDKIEALHMIPTLRVVRDARNIQTNPTVTSTSVLLL